MAKKNSAVRSKLQKRNTAVMNDFRHLFNKKGLRPDVIYEKLADKYYLASETIQKIINKEAKITETEKRPP